MLSNLRYRQRVLGAFETLTGDYLKVYTGQYDSQDKYEQAIKPMNKLFDTILNQTKE